MNLSIKTKILFIFASLVLLSSAINIGIASFAVQKNLTNDLIARVVTNTKAEISDLTNFILIDDKEGVVNLIYNQKVSHKDLAYIIVLDQNNNVIASTLINENPDSIVPKNVLPSGQDQQVNLVTDQYGNQVYDIALRLDYGQGVLRAGYYKQQIDQSVRSIFYLLILGAISSLVFALLVGFFFGRAFFKPLDDLKDSVQKVGAGDLSVKAKVTSKDELGFLAEAFNKMTFQLRQSYEVLEQKVKQRTKEAESKVQELESINKLMVDRELKMIELKKENEKLKKLNS